MAWDMAAMAGINFISSIEKSKAEAESILADNRLQRERLAYARQRQNETYQRNTSNVDRAEKRNAVNIEKARLQAESELSSQFAGSGISGTSVGELSTEVQSEAAQAHNDNIRVSDETQSQLFLERRNTLEDNEFAIRQMQDFDAKQAATGAVLSGLSGAASRFNPSKGTGLKKGG